jgi:peptidoglycan/LPS O-acetylase OafA/YrhL
MTHDLHAERNFGLDLMRVMALSLTLLAHGSALWMPAYVEELRYVAVYAGFFGVEAFFVLSGFLIGGKLLSVAHGEAGLKSFWIGRWFRTLPNYYLFLGLNFCLSWLLFQRPTGDWRYLWFGQNLFAPMPVFFFPESWSLAVEEWFYLLAPLLLLGLALIARAIGKPLQRALWVSLFALLVLFPLLRLNYAQVGMNWDSEFRKVVIWRFDALLYGLAAAGLLRYAPLRFFNSVRQLGVGGLVLLAGLAVCLAHFDPNQSPALAAFSLSFAALGFAMTIPWFWRWRSCRHVLLRQLITRLSQWTYAAYLIHLLLIFVLLHYFGTHLQAQPLRMLSLTVVWLLLTFVGASLIYRFFEKPLTDLRDRFSAREHE